MIPSFPRFPLPHQLAIFQPCHQAAGDLTSTPPGGYSGADSGPVAGGEDVTLGVETQSRSHPPHLACKDNRQPRGVPRAGLCLCLLVICAFSRSSLLALWLEHPGNCMVIAGFFKSTLPPTEYLCVAQIFPVLWELCFIVLVASSHHLSHVCYLSLYLFSQTIRNVRLLSVRATQNSWVFTENHKSHCVSCTCGSSRIFYC